MAKTFKPIEVSTERSIRKQSGTAIFYRPCWKTGTIFYCIRTFMWWIN